jgi:hypothetical protein
MVEAAKQGGLVKFVPRYLSASPDSRDHQILC